MWSEILLDGELDLLKEHPLEGRKVVLLVEQEKRGPIVVGGDRPERKRTDPARDKQGVGHPAMSRRPSFRLKQREV